MDLDGTQYLRSRTEGVTVDYANRPPSRCALTVDILRAKRARCGWPDLACHPKLAEGERRMVDQNIASWNQVGKWLSQVETLRQAAGA